MSLVIGIIFVSISWIISWIRLPILSENAFFPLWVGYILSVNGFSELLFQTSLLKRMKASLIWLFILSIPLWWYFELYNSVLHNWHYILLHPTSSFEYNVRASIDFSTVIPAVLSTSFLFTQGTQRIIKPPSIGVPIGNGFLAGCILLGIASLIIMPVFPKETFPLVWMGLFFIIDPVNYLLGYPSIVSKLKDDNLHICLAIMAATLFTGFWWEMWNFYSLPKWYYTIPYVGFLKVFEMPILGYLGYPFFGLEVFSYTMFAVGIYHTLKKRGWAKCSPRLSQER